MTAIELLRKYNGFPRCKIYQGFYNFLGEWSDCLVYTCKGQNDKDIPFKKLEKVEVYRFEFDNYLCIYVKEFDTEIPRRKYEK